MGFEPKVWPAVYSWGQQYRSACNPRDPIEGGLGQ
jgi:hypothetical protein